LGTDFSNATLVAMSIGIGTFNPGVTTYFDDVQINVGTLNLAYDFNPQPLDNSVPESSTMTLSLILAGAGVGAAARRWPRSPVTQ